MNSNVYPIILLNNVSNLLLLQKDADYSKDVTPISDDVAFSRLMGLTNSDRGNLRILFNYYKMIFSCTYKKINCENYMKRFKGFKLHWYNKWYFNYLRKHFKPTTNGVKLFSLLVNMWLIEPESLNKDFKHHLQKFLHPNEVNYLSLSDKGRYQFHLFFDLDFGFHIIDYVAHNNIQHAFFNFKRLFAYVAYDSKYNGDIMQQLIQHNSFVHSRALDFKYLKSIDNQRIKRVVDKIYPDYINFKHYADKVDYNII